MTATARRSITLAAAALAVGALVCGATASAAVEM